MTMTSDETSDLTAQDPLDVALSRLDKAVGAIQSRMDSLEKESEEARSRPSGHDDIDEDRARLADALDQSREREEQLKTLANEASQALGETIEDLRNALSSAEPS